MPKQKRPGAIIVAGERWPTHVLRVVERDSDGNPRTFRVLRDDETAELSDDPGQNMFFVIYGPPGMTPPRKN